MPARSPARRRAAPPETPTSQPANPTSQPAKPTSIALGGSPRAINGRIPLANDGPDRLIVRSGTLALEGHESIVVPLGVALRPGTSTEAPLSIDLGPEFPPGQHSGELEVAGVRLPVTITVEQSISVDLAPKSVLAAAGRAEIRLTVRNDGNVAIPLAAHTRGRLFAHDSPDDPTSTQRRPGGTDESPDADLTLSASVQLEPGETRTLEAVLDVPAGLDATRRHRAALPVGPADLVVIVLPTDPSDAGSQPVTT